MGGRKWGELAYDHLAIPDGELFRRWFKDFESVLFATEKILSVVREIYDAAFQTDPSGTGVFLEAKWLCKDVGIADLQLQEYCRYVKTASIACRSLHNSTTLNFRKLRNENCMFFVFT